MRRLKQSEASTASLGGNQIPQQKRSELFRTVLNWRQYFGNKNKWICILHIYNSSKRPQERFKTIFSNYFETAQTNRLSNYFQVIEFENFAAKTKQIIVASVDPQRLQLMYLTLFIFWVQREFSIPGIIMRIRMIFSRSTMRNDCLCLDLISKHEIEKMKSRSCFKARDWKNERINSCFRLEKWGFHSN